jgi:hypothetical protein
MSLGLWTPAVTGDVGVGRLDADIDWSIGDVISDLNFAIFPGFEVGKDKWVLIFNGAYAQLEDEASFSSRGGLIEGDADVTMDLYIADLAVGYRLFDIPLGGDGATDMVLSLTPVIGVRYTYISLEIDPDRIETRSGHEDWWDPYVGARANLRFNDQWAWRTEGTVGGFGVGSDFAWTAQTTLDWRFHNNWEVNIHRLPRCVMGLRQRRLQVRHGHARPVARNCLHSGLIRESGRPPPKGDASASQTGISTAAPGSRSDKQ